VGGGLTPELRLENSRWKSSLTSMSNVKIKTRVRRTQGGVPKEKKQKKNKNGTHPKTASLTGWP